MIAFIFITSIVLNLYSLGVFKKESIVSKRG